MALLRWQELVDLPTLHQGHFANLKLDTGVMRVWISRMTIADGETQPVQVEKLIDGVWIDITADKNGRYSLNEIELENENGPTGFTIQTINRRFAPYSEHAWLNR